VIVGCAYALFKINIITCFTFDVFDVGKMEKLRIREKLNKADDYADDDKILLERYSSYLVLKNL